MSTSKLYETDYGARAKRQIELLGSRRFADLDIVHLALSPGVPLYVGPDPE